MPVFAAVQMQPNLLDKKANLKKIAEIMEKASKKNVEFAVFPECCLTGYDLSLEEAKGIAITLPGSETEFLGVLCQKFNMYIVVGSVVAEENEKFYNEAILIGPEGLVGSYRKTHMPFLGVDRFLNAGDKFPVIFDTKVGKIGLMVCYDVFFPEAARLHGIYGAQIVAIPTAWLASHDQYPEFVRARASENDIYVIGTNWVGEERGSKYLGCATIAGPSGEILARGSNSEEEVLCAEIDLSNTHRGRLIFDPGKFEMDLWNQRRPDLYGPIAVDNRTENLYQ